MSDIAIKKQAELAPAFINDITFLARGKNFSITHAKIHSMMTRPNGAYEWSREHNSLFEMNKLQLKDFSRKKERDPTHKGKMHLITRPPLDLSFSKITLSSTHKLLGLILDQEL